MSSLKLLARLRSRSRPWQPMIPMSARQLVRQLMTRQLVRQLMRPKQPIHQRQLARQLVSLQLHLRRRQAVLGQQRRLS